MKSAIVLALLCTICIAAGCSSEQHEPSKFVETPTAVYEGLKGQTVAVMVWADWRTRTEYNQIQIDTARRVTERLANRKTEKKKSDAPPTEFIDPVRVVRYQREHPEIMSLPITEVAPKLGVSRVIYIEFEEFTAQSPEAVMLLRGSAKSTLRVLEVHGNSATIAFEEADIHDHFPPDAPEGVIASDKVTVRTIYDGTLDLLAEKLVARFK